MTKTVYNISARKARYASYLAHSFIGELKDLVRINFLITQVGWSKGKKEAEF